MIEELLESIYAELVAERRQTTPNEEYKIADEERKEPSEEVSDSLNMDETTPKNSGSHIANDKNATNRTSATASSNAIKATEPQASTREGQREFNLREAVIYSEILKPKFEE